MTVIWLLPKIWLPNFCNLLRMASPHAAGDAICARARTGCGAGRRALCPVFAGTGSRGRWHRSVAGRARNQPQTGAWADARQLAFHKVDASLGIFDTVLMMGNNFGLFANPRRAKWMLRRFKKLTSQNARIVAESLDVCGTD